MIQMQTICLYRDLRHLQGKKVQLELRTIYNRRLLTNEMFLSWAVSFNPPENLLSTQRAIESMVGFRYKQAKRSIGMLNDLMREESERLIREIQAAMASLEVHYQQPEVRNDDITEALDALATFMTRTREQEQSELNRRFSAISNAPLAALWCNLQSGTQLPPGAIWTNVEPQQNFRGPGRGARHPPWRGGQGRPSRGIRGRGTTRERQNNCTLQAMMTLLSDMIN